MMEVIRAEEKHVHGIVDIWKELMDQHRELDSYYTCRADARTNWEQFLKQRMNESSDLVLVGLDNDKVIAYSIAMIKDYPPVFQIQKHGFISDMGVNIKYRRKGVGEMMLKKMLAWFDSHKLERIELRVAFNNDIGINFWKKHGFKEQHYTMYLER